MTRPAAGPDGASNIGAAVQRREDPRLLTGAAEYADDIQHRHNYHLAIHRSREAAATIEAVDTTAAQAMDGVVATYTAETLRETRGAGTLPTTDAGDRPPVAQPVLAGDRVVYQGQPIAAILATDRATAAEAADAVEVTYDRHEAVVDPSTALEETDSPSVHDSVPDNLAFDWTAGDRDAAVAAIEAADRVVDVDLEINRLLPTAVEPRAAVARYEESSDELSIDLSTQRPHDMRPALSSLLDIPARRIQVRSPDVGGGFGPKCRFYSAYAMCARAAMDVDAPVKWTATRAEEHTSIVHSREHHVTARVGVDEDGRIRGFHAETLAPVGAYLFPAAVLVPTNLGLMAKGQYDIPHAFVHTRGAYTTTTPLSAYRGAGRPEATYWIERAVRIVADELGLDPVDLRRRNQIDPDEFPYDSGLGRVYDSGDYEATMEKALGKIDYPAFRERQERARAAGQYLGVGISSYVQACGSGPGRPEVGSVELGPDGTAVVKTGTAEIGTGLETAFSQIVADALAIDIDDIEVRMGDTEQTEYGSGTSGSRSIPVAGNAISESADDVREKAARIAAHALEVAPADVTLGERSFHVVGAPDQSVSIAEVADLAHSPGELPADIEPGLAATTYFEPDNYTSTFGCHVAIVNVDPDSGEIDIERYIAIDDVGTQLNPTLLEGQIHGGVVQGIGQALYEDVVYDANAQLTTGSLQDYAVPRAHHVPEIEWDSTVTPTPHNPLGTKGAGEAGSVAAPPAIVNAVIDALEPFGVRDIDMPLTPERVWRACN
ncbi:MAG: xanthine dehydrogenase family protein molybdopterin-binding subunit [Salinirussus sp.]